MRERRSRRSRPRKQERIEGEFVVGVIVGVVIVVVFVVVEFGRELGRTAMAVCPRMDMVGEASPLLIVICGAKLTPSRITGQRRLRLPRGVASVSPSAGVKRRRTRRHNPKTPSVEEKAEIGEVAKIMATTVAGRAGRVDDDAVA
ncbi:hypothetical protein Sjap_014606 [Stephania japonica]|uniref:Uncharacterized protein n=1 Tax=Stephania japonica TaxID=461633 RepID=A0AAP0NRM0_9MAGN